MGVVDGNDGICNRKRLDSFGKSRVGYVGSSLVNDKRKTAIEMRVYYLRGGYNCENWGKANEIIELA